MGDFLTVRTDPLPRTWNDFARDVRQLVSSHFGAEGTGWWLVDVTVLAPEGGRQMAVVNVSQVGGVWDAHRFLIDVSGLDGVLLPDNVQYPLVLYPFYLGDPSQETFLISAYTRQFAAPGYWRGRSPGHIPPPHPPGPRPGPHPHPHPHPGPGPRPGPHPGPGPRTGPRPHRP